MRLRRALWALAAVLSVMLLAASVVFSGPAALAEFMEDYTLSTTTPYALAAQTGSIAVGAFGSSGDLKDKYGAYVAFNAFDGNPATTWAEAVSGDGEGETLDATWRPMSGEWQITGVALRAGYHKSRDIYSKNNRPSTVEIEIRTDAEARDYLVSLNDEMNWQYVLFDAPMAMSGSAYARLTLWDVYRGSKYRDTCVSEFDLLVVPTAAAGGSSNGGFQYDGETSNGEGTPALPDLSNDLGGWFGSAAGKADAAQKSDVSVGGGVQASGGVSPYASRMLFALYNNMSDAEAQAQLDLSGRCNDVYGSVDGVDVGYMATITDSGVYASAKDMLLGFLDFSWYNPYETDLAPLITEDARVTLVRSELYAWNPQLVQPTNVDEYYLFEIVKGGVTYDVLYNTGYEMDGGDWSEGRILGTR